MKITIIGTGYVGLVTGCCLAEFGHDVTCVDKVKAKIETLKKGEIPIYEPGLSDMVCKNTKKGRLVFTTDVKASVSGAEAIFIAVGTPTLKRSDGRADLQYVYAAAKEIAPYLKEYSVIVNKSTVPVGTAFQVAAIIRNENQSVNFDMASNPEFLREGAAIVDFMHPDRVVIGVNSTRATQVLKEIYNPLYLLKTPLIITTIETAELIKYSANAFLAIKISFANEMARLCEKVGADISMLVTGIGKDGRIGSKFLHPGPGYGGSCFPKDTVALLRTAHEHDVSLLTVKAAVDSNIIQKNFMIEKIRTAMGDSIKEKVIAVLGLTFKPETNDMRESPSLTILPPLIIDGALIRAHDPKGMPEAKNMLPGSIHYVANAYEACDGADAVVLMTEWNEYRALDLKRIKRKMKGSVFIDLRNVYMPKIMREKGFVYSGVGQ